MSGSGWDAFPDVRELLEGPTNTRQWWRGPPDVREWSGDSLECLCVVASPSRMSGSGREAFPDVRELSGDPFGCLGVFEGLQDIWEWSGGVPKFLGVVKWPSRMSESGRETLPNVREWSGGPPGCP